MATRFGFRKQSTQTLDKLQAVFIIKEDIRSGNTSDDNMLQQTGNVDTSSAWHENNIAGFLDLSTTSP